MSDPGKDNNYGSITDPILSPSPGEDMTETELSELADTAANTDPLKGSDSLPEEMELNKVYETIGQCLILDGVNNMIDLMIPRE